MVNHFWLPEFFHHSAPSSARLKAFRWFLVLFRHNTELCFTSDNEQPHRICIPLANLVCVRWLWNMRETRIYRLKTQKRKQIVLKGSIIAISRAFWNFKLSDEILGMLRLGQLTLVNHFEFAVFFFGPLDTFTWLNCMRSWTNYTESNVQRMYQ